MALTIHTHGGIGLIKPSGRFDAHMAPEVKVLLDRSDAPAQLVVDLSTVTFIDSTALAALVRGMKNCRQKGGDLRLCGLQQPVRIIFELTRLDRAFEMFANEDAAISSFA